MLGNNGSMSCVDRRYNYKGLQFQVKGFGCYKILADIAVVFTIPRYCVSGKSLKVWELEGFQEPKIIDKREMPGATHSATEGISLRSAVL